MNDIGEILTQLLIDFNIFSAMIEHTFRHHVSETIRTTKQGFAVTAMKKRMLLFSSLILLFFLSGCSFFNHNAQIEIIRQTPQQSLQSKHLLAGAARADITPPPGMPMAGYSMWANYGKGFRTRLFARVLYLKPRSGSAVALVQCDLLTGSLLLNQRVAERIASKTDVGMEGLTIAGTHTHSGPGNYFENNFYNDHASNAAGFDSGYFDYLSGQIAEAIIRAYADRKPARIATGKVHIRHMTRNRSIQSYQANKNIAAKKLPDSDEAVNPELYMIRVDVKDNNQSYRPLAAVSSFSIHGTAVPSGNNLYNGDVFAYMEREVERGIQNDYKTSWEPIHAAFNGTHADGSPNYQKQGFTEARRIGTFVGQKALELFHSLDGKLKDDVTVNFAAREIDVFSEPCVDGICLCPRPVVGASLAAGADDGPSPVIRKLPWLRQGSARWFFTTSCQGHKRTLAGPLQYLFLRRNNFPHRLFLQTIQIDDVLIVPLPFETTKEAGVRLAGQCRAKLMAENKNDLRHVVVVSCANGYFGYVTTPEEYSIQRYEGGHTLYGPQTQPFLAAHVSKLTLAMKNGARAAPLPEKWSYTLREKNFTTGHHADETTGRKISDPAFVASKVHDEPYWSVVWQDRPPGLISWGKTMVRIEESTDKKSWKQSLMNGQPLNDSGYDIAVLHHKTINRGSTGVYETRWYNPPAHVQDKYYRFVILPQAGQDLLYSEAFNQTDQIFSAPYFNPL